MSSMRSSVVLLLAFTIFSCTSVAKRENKNVASELSAPAGPSKEEALKSYAEQTSDNTVITLKPNGKVQTPPTSEAKVKAAPAEAAPVAPKVVAPAAPEVAAGSHRHSGPVAWAKALGWLKNGNTRFLTHRLRQDGQASSDVKRLAAGQTPHSIILSCSDSRVPPELIFDQKLGEIFTVRVAGEMLDAATIGSIEYAVEHLGSNLILVMGHTSCGAIKAAHSTLDGGSAGSPSLDKLVGDIQPRIRTYAGKTPTAGYIKESWANVKGVAKDLLERSPLLATAVQNGDLKIAEAMYDTSTGVVTVW